MLPLQVRARTWMRSGRGAGDSPQEGDPTVAAGPPFSLEPGGGWWSRVAKCRFWSQMSRFKSWHYFFLPMQPWACYFLCLHLPICKVGIIIMHPSQVCEMIK